MRPRSRIQRTLDAPSTCRRGAQAWDALMHRDPDDIPSSVARQRVPDPTACSTADGFAAAQRTMWYIGQMTMRARPEGLLIPAGGQVDLAPGGLHLMLIGVREPLAAGQTLPVELRFEKAGTVTVELTVRPRG